MFTKNFKAIISSQFANCRGNYVSYRLKKMDGSVSTAQWEYTQLTYSLDDEITDKSLFFHVGNGKTEATSNDYCMEDEINDLSLIEAGNYNDIALWKLSDTLVTPLLPTEVMGDILTVTYRNETDSAVTINEIGYSIKSSDNNGRFLLFREVIEPIILNPQDVYTFTIKLL